MERERERGGKEREREREREREAQREKGAEGDGERERERASETLRVAVPLMVRTKIVVDSQQLVDNWGDGAASWWYYVPGQPW